MKKIGLITLVLASLAAVPAFAQTATTNVPVSANIANTCTISNAPVLLGAYDPVVTNDTVPKDGSGSVTITCTRGAVTSVSLGLGQNPVATQRQMSDGAAPPSFMAYELYQPPNNTPGAACSYTGAAFWRDTVGNLFTPATAPSRAARTYNICGRIAAGQDLPSGNYSDLVLATVNF